MLLALLGLPVFMAVWAMNSIASTAYETCVATEPFMVKNKIFVSDRKLKA